jgi:ATP-binding cassette subfamily B protein
MRYGILNALSANILSMLVYVFVAVKTVIGHLAIGSIVQYIGGITRFNIGFTGLATSISELFVNIEALNLYFDFLDKPAKMHHGSVPIEKDNDNKYEIEFCDVSFRYPGTETYSLKNFELKINTGQRMAVVGMNGSGKTTMIKLLCRLYEPTEGKITLNGININEYNDHDYTHILSVVFQDFKLFSFPLGQNVAADMHYDAERVAASLKKAGFLERASGMPKGLDTPLYKDFDEDGVEISGGEAQKIAIARAFYKDAPLIVLDEPTAALDPVAEFEIYSAFNESIENKTIIFISHRLSSCRFCHDIAVFHEGQLVQRGNHDTLILDEGNKYYELWNAQAQYYQHQQL